MADIMEFMEKSLEARSKHDLLLDDPLAKKLIDTCHSGRVEQITEIFEQGRDPNFTTALGSPLTVSIRSESEATKKVLKLLSLGADVEFLEYDGFTPLTIAATNGKPEIVRLLIQNGAKLDSQEHPMRWTALMNAACLGQALTVTELLNHGADICLKSEHGLTAIDIARGNGKRGILSLFLRFMEKKLKR